MIADNTPEWFAARVGIPTASLLADIMSSDRSGKAPGAPFARLVAEKAVEILEHEGTRYIRVPQMGADLSHEDHGTIKLAPGEYEVRIQREYTPEAIVNVRD